MSAGVCFRVFIFSFRVYSNCGSCVPSISLLITSLHLLDYFHVHPSLLTPIGPLFVNLPVYVRRPIWPPPPLLVHSSFFYSILLFANPPPIPLSTHASVNSVVGMNGDPLHDVDEVVEADEPIGVGIGKSQHLLQFVLPQTLTEKLHRSPQLLNA